MEGSLGTMPEAVVPWRRLWLLWLEVKRWYLRPGCWWWGWRGGHVETWTVTHPAWWSLISQQKLLSAKWSQPMMHIIPVWYCGFASESGAPPLPVAHHFLSTCCRPAFLGLDPRSPLCEFSGCCRSADLTPIPCTFSEALGQWFSGVECVNGSRSAGCNAVSRTLACRGSDSLGLPGSQSLTARKQHLGADAGSRIWVCSVF